MSTEPETMLPPPAAKKRKAWSIPFLLASITLHLLFATGAGYYVVQQIQAKRKLQFQEGPPTASASKRALEHKVSLQKKRNAGGAPAQAKRLAVSGLAAKITLPEMPSMPVNTTQVVVGRMAGLGGAGFGTGMGFGNGSGSGVGGGTGGLGLTMFGVRGGGDGLIGTFYDLKQTFDRKPSEMQMLPGEPFDPQSKEAMRYKTIVDRFTNSWNPNVLAPYYRAPAKLATTQLFIPKTLADTATTAFGVEKECVGRRWLVHYKGQIIAPKDGKFRFVGSGDDILVVRIRSANVLEGSFPAYRVMEKINTEMNAGAAPVCPLVAGKWIDMRRNEVIPMEVLIGENPGGDFTSFLLIEEQGAEHPPGAFAVFQLKKADIPTGDAPAYQGTLLFDSKPMPKSAFGTMMR